MNPHIKSRHRLPQSYRVTMVVLWLTPIVLLLGTLAFFNGVSLQLFHPITLLAALVMALPAWYVWNEGVDVTEKALVIRITGWRTRRFDQLDTWYFDQRSDEPILTVWDDKRRRVIDTHAAHLSDLPVLLRTLKAEVRYRSWPT